MEHDTQQASSLAIRRYTPYLQSCNRSLKGAGQTELTVKIVQLRRGEERIEALGGPVGEDLAAANGVLQMWKSLADSIASSEDLMHPCGRRRTELSSTAHMATAVLLAPPIAADGAHDR